MSNIQIFKINLFNVVNLLQVTSNSEGVIFLDPIQSVQKEANFLTEQGIDIIIVLSHCGLDVDK